MTIASHSEPNYPKDKKLCVLLQNDTKTSSVSSLNKFILIYKFVKHPVFRSKNSSDFSRNDNTFLTPPPPSPSLPHPSQTGETV